MVKKGLLISAFVLICLASSAQRVGSSPEYIKALTAEWKGERFPDGRPKVSDAILKRLKNISVEEAWGVLRSKGYHNQFEGDWTVIWPDSAMTGRVVTAQYMPLRPDLQNQVKEQGKVENRAQKGGTNSWPIDILLPGDVYVADGYGKIADGTLIGDNLGNSIYREISTWCYFLWICERSGRIGRDQRIQRMDQRIRPFFHFSDDAHNDQCADPCWPCHGVARRCCACKKVRNHFYSGASH